jgi:hypothetical protein
VPMVYCRQCQKKVDDCEHFVHPIEAKRVSVFDARVETIAYSRERRILEIAFKSGQVWQLFGVPPDIHDVLQESTISSFLNFIAHRYKSAPVKTGMNAVPVPESEKCRCGVPMRQKHRTGSDFEKFVRVLWSCPSCNASEWRKYGAGIERERRTRWH